MSTKEKQVEKVQEKFEDTTECLICTETFKDPKVLPCIHTFCMTCLQQTGLSTRKGPGDKMPCPICRTEFTIPEEGFDGLKRNFFMERLIEMKNFTNPSSAGALCDICHGDNYFGAEAEIPSADMYCADCNQRLCGECCKNHRKYKATKNHRLLSLDGASIVKPYVCDKHENKPLEIYCSSCQETVCSLCFYASHETHDASPVIEVVADFRKIIQENAESMMPCVLGIKQRTAETDNDKDVFVEKVSAVESEIKRIKQNLQEYIEKACDSLLQQLDSIKQERIKEIESQHYDIEAVLVSLESYQAYCSQVTTVGSEVDVCKAVHDLSTRATDLKQCYELVSFKPFPTIGLETNEFLSALFRQDKNIIGKIEVGFGSNLSVEGMPTEHEVQKKLQQMTVSQSLTRQQRNGILQKMKSFRFPNVAITTCIFEDDYVEFYFVLEGTSSIDKSLLVNEIVTSLQVDVSFAERIRVTQLKSKPRGERTNSGPGNPIKNITAQPCTMTTLGAFVSIEGKGDHVLSCGHDKKVGHMLSTDNNEIIGQTQAVVCCVEDGQSYDAAVAKVQNINYTKSVVYEGRRLHLSNSPVDPVRGTVIQCFPPQPMASRATIRHVDYNSFEHNLYGCMSVITDNREDFHKPGESGLVVTSLPSEEFPERVDPIGMLFFREFIQKTDDGRGYFLSLAIPMTKNLERLQEDEYCGGKNITILSDARVKSTGNNVANIKR